MPDWLTHERLQSLGIVLLAIAFIWHSWNTRP